MQNNLETFDFRRLGPGDLALARQLNVLFAKAFEDEETYQKRQPSDAYLLSQLAKDSVLILVALKDSQVVGALVAYILDKLEQERSEAYLYDLAVDERWRRRGIARRLINELKPIAKASGAWVIFVQADQIDEPAVRLYESMGVREEPFHFDIPLD